MKDRVLIVTAIVAVHLIIITLFVFSGSDPAGDATSSTSKTEETQVPEGEVAEGSEESAVAESDRSSDQVRDDLFDQVTGAAGKGEEYIVQPGDSLMAISKKKYGTSRHYLLIYENNKQILKSPSDVRVGQKLILPQIP